MRVEIIKIENDTIKAIAEDDKIITIPKSEMGFDCKIGDSVLIEEEDSKKVFFCAKKCPDINRGCP